MPAVPRSRFVLFALLASGGCLLDLLSKHWVFDWLGMPGGRTWWIWDGVFSLQTSLNEGALFGFAQGKAPVFATLSVVAAIGVVYWLFVAGAAVDRLLTISLGMISGGILGNLYDRLGWPGLVWHQPSPLHAVGEPVYAVRDWILVMIGSYHWPNFNIADSLLVCGAILLAYQAIQSEFSNSKKA